MATFDSGTTKKYALSTADTATANIYAIQEATTAATIKLVGAGDSVYLEGLSSEYTIKASKTKVTLHSDTQTITIDLSKSTGAQTLVLIDGAYSLVKGTKSISVNGTAVSKVVELDSIDTTDNTAANTYFNSGSGSSSTGSTFTLTTGVDTTLTGGSGNDTYIADNTGADVTSTADALNGGDGTDTINIYSDGAAGALPALTSIEVANIYEQNDTFTLTSNSWDSVTTVNEIRGDGSILNLGDKVTTVGLTDLVVKGIALTTNDTVVAFDAALTSATLNLSGITAAGVAADENIALTGAALTTLTVNVTSDSTFDVLDAAAATSITLNATGALTTTVATTGTATLTITGAGAVDVGALDADIDTVTATANTGGLTAAIGANVDTVLTGSAGNDTITAGTTDALVTADALAVNAGAGTGDMLIVVAAADISSTADGARYTNFETLRVSASQAVSQVAGITQLQLAGGATAQTYSGLNATNAGNVQVRVTEETPTFTLTTATGTTDALTLKMGTGSAATAATSITTGMTVTGFETLNIQENGGATATAGANRTATVAAFTGATLNDINLTGRAVTLSNIATTVAVDIDGSALTGNGATISVGLTLAGSAVAGSSIHGSSVRDAYTIGAEGSTYDGGAGNDTFTTSSAILLADGVTDGTIVGGLGTDTIILNAASTLTDLSFTNVTGVEALTLLGGAANESVTGLAGSAKTAFATGVTVTTATTLANDQTFTWASGIYDKAVTLTLVSDGVGNTTGDNISITTGSAADTISVTAGSWIGNAATGGVYAISTGAGADSITITSGAILATGAISVTGGTGADTITATTSHAVTTGLGVVYNIASGDSTTTAYDVITGFDAGSLAADLLSDSLNVAGTTVVANTAATDGTNSGTILSHAITGGIITFDDNNTFTTAVVVNATNLADVLAYLALNTSTNDVVAFAYDSDASGTADATFVYSNDATDTLVELVAQVGTSLSFTNTATLGLIDLN